MKRHLGVLLALLLALTAFAGCQPAAPPAVEEPASFTVAFDVTKEAEQAGVKAPGEQTVKNGSTAVEPTVSWKGYEVAGWYNGEARWDFASQKVTSSLTLVARWRAAADENTAEKYEENLTWGEAGHLYVHYMRVDHNPAEAGVVNGGAPVYGDPISSEVYADWGLWTWEYSPINSEGRTFNGMKVDESGVVYDIKLNETYGDGGWDSENRTDLGLEINYANAEVLGIQLFSHDSRTNGSGFWANDGGNVYIDLTQAKREKGDYHWFVRQGYCQNGTSRFTEAVAYDPYAGVEPGTAVSKYDVVSKYGANETYGKVPVASGWEDTAVGYQIFVASFADSDGDGLGDLRGIIENLDYFTELGVDVLWLTPIQQSNSYHGYDIKDYFTIDPRFGTLADYRELLAKAHDKGIRVLMDFVLNHTSDSNPWFIKSQNLVKERVTLPDGTEKEIDYRNFYNWKNKDQVPKEGDAAGQWFADAHGYSYYSSFNSGMPELNFDNQDTRDAILDVALYWMSFGLDGFRLDAAKHIYMENENDDHSNWIVQDGAYSYDLKKNQNFYLEFNAKLKSVFPSAILVAENLSGDPAKLGGMYPGLDSQFNFNTYYDIAGNLGLIGWGDQNKHMELWKKYETSQGNFEMYRSDYIDSNFTSNHDVQRARERVLAKFDSDTNDWASNGVRTDNEENKQADIAQSERMYKAYVQILMTLPGITWIYNGDELGMFGTISENPDGRPGHEDRVYRQPMKWTTERAGSEYNCRYDIGFNGYMMEWNELNAALPGLAEQREDPDSIFNWVKQMIKLRKEHPTLADGRLKSHGAYNDYLTKGVFCYQLEGSSGIYKVFHNVGKQSAAVYNFQTTGTVITAPEGWTPGSTSIPAQSLIILKQEEAA